MCHLRSVLVPFGPRVNQDTIYISMLCTEAARSLALAAYSDIPPTDIFHATGIDQHCRAAPVISPVRFARGSLHVELVCLQV